MSIYFLGAFPAEKNTGGRTPTDDRRGELDNPREQKRNPTSAMHHNIRLHLREPQVHLDPSMDPLLESVPKAVGITMAGEASSLKKSPCSLTRKQLCKHVLRDVLFQKAAPVLRVMPPRPVTT